MAKRAYVAQVTAKTVAAKTVAAKTGASRQFPIGAEVCTHGVDFRVWAQKRKRVEVVLDAGETFPLTAEGDGYFRGIIASAKAGTRYRYRLDGGEKLFPDPASRYQPEGPHGPSQVIDPSAFAWSDTQWPGLAAHGQVIYELHVGTFTPEGTWRAAIAQLAAIADLGVTCIEMMPVAEFAGRWGWGYDGVDLFAPFHHYGAPDDLRAFVDAAHQAGLGVILDVVYNHFGPDGNYLCEFSDAYLKRDQKNDWGSVINFDGAGAGPVREFFIANARYFIREFHLDGFRFDATQAIEDHSPRHLLAEISTAARDEAAPRTIYLTNENEPQHTRLVRPIADGGYGMTSLWNDDFHHAAQVALGGHSEAYYTDYRGAPQEFIAAAKFGYLYQGQRYTWQEQRRGSLAFDLPPSAFVQFLQNHDQVANSATGARMHQVGSPAQVRAMTTLLLLMPQTPMLFAGQEFAASSPFHFFADHEPELAEKVRAGRRAELSQFPSIATVLTSLPDPGNEETFRRCGLNFAERTEPVHAMMLALHRELLRLRKSETVFAREAQRGGLDGAVLAERAFVLRYFGAQPADDRLLLVNLGDDLALQPAPEPLLAPPRDHHFAILFSSEDPRYGGEGTPPCETVNEGWFLAAHSAIVAKPTPGDPPPTRHARTGSIKNRPA